MKTQSKAFYPPSRSSSYPRQASFVDLTNPVTLATLFKSDYKRLSNEETVLLKEIRHRIHKHGKTELIDFSSNSLHQVRDGNTVAGGVFVRRGLPTLEENITVPAKSHFELITYLKTNGDCCMFSYLEQQNLFLVATRAVSTLVKDSNQLKEIENSMHQEISKVLFQFIDQLDKTALADLKSLLAGHTWVGEYLSNDNLIQYDDPKILLHSIVENKTGVVKADAETHFKKFGFQIVPSKSYGVLETRQINQKIDELKSQTLSLPMTETHEGIVIQLIDRQQNVVAHSMKVKAIEYQLFKQMNSCLISALESNQIETHFEKLLQEQLKEQRQIIQMTKHELPHSEIFYQDVLSTAFTMVSQRKSPVDYKNYRDNLQSNQVQFFTDAIQVMNEKKARTEANTGEVSFRNTKIFHRITKIQPTQKGTWYAQPKLLVIVCPPFCLSMSCIKLFSQQYTLQTAETVANFDFYTTLQTVEGKRPLLLLQSLDGLYTATQKLHINVFIYQITAESSKLLVNNLCKQETDFYAYSTDLSTVRLRKAISSFENLSRTEFHKFSEANQAFSFSNEEELLNLLTNLANQSQNLQNAKRQAETNLKIIRHDYDNFDQNFDVEQPNIKNKDIVFAGKSVRLKSVEKQEQPSRVRVQRQDPSSDSEKSSTHREDYEQGSVIILIPIGLQGIDCMQLFTTQVEPSLYSSYPNSQIEILTDDDLREDQVNRYLKKFETKTRGQAERATQSQVARQFTQKVQKSINRLKQQHNLSVIFLSRVYTPLQLNKILEKLELDSQVKPVGLIPSITQSQNDNPLSLGYLLQCFCKSLNQQSQVNEYQEQISLFKRILLGYSQFEGIELREIVAESVKVDMGIIDTKLPKDLQSLMLEVVLPDAINDIDLLEDTFNRIEEYRLLFGGQNHHNEKQNNTKLRALTAIMTEMARPGKQKQRKQRRNRRVEQLSDDSEDQYYDSAQEQPRRNNRTTSLSPNREKQKNQVEQNQAKQSAARNQKNQKPTVSPRPSAARSGRTESSPNPNQRNQKSFQSQQPQLNNARPEPVTQRKAQNQIVRQESKPKAILKEPSPARRYQSENSDEDSRSRSQKRVSFQSKVQVFEIPKQQQATQDPKENQQKNSQPKNEKQVKKYIPKNTQNEPSENKKLVKVPENENQNDSEVEQREPINVQVISTTPIEENEVVISPLISKSQITPREPLVDLESADQEQSDEREEVDPEAPWLELESPKEKSEQEDERIPDMYILKSMHSQAELHQVFKQIMPQIFDKVFDQNDEELKHLINMWKEPSDTQHGGWQMLSESTILLELISRNQYKLEDSRIWQGEQFKPGQSLKVEIVGILLVPGKVILGVGLPIEKMIDVPCMLIAKHESLGEIDELVDLCGQTVQQRNAAFKEFNKSNSEIISAKIKLSGQEEQSVHFAKLEQAFSLDFQTQIKY